MSSAASARRRDNGFTARCSTPASIRTNLINLATALHREALALELHRSAGWVSRNFPAIISWPTNTELWDEWEAIYCDDENDDTRGVARRFYDEHRAEMDAGAVVLWPAGENLYTLMQLRVEIGRHGVRTREARFAGESGTVRVARGIFCRPHLVRQIGRRTSRFARSLSTQAKAATRGAATTRPTCCSASIARASSMFEADMARRPTPQLVADGVAICGRFRPNAFGVEANQFQELLCGEFASEFARQGISHTIPAAIHNTSNKLVRIRRLGPYLSQRRLRFLADSPSTRLLVDQLRDFPNGAHDDGPDALEMALRLAEDVCHGYSADDGLGDRLRVV